MQQFINIRGRGKILFYKTKISLNVIFQHFPCVSEMHQLWNQPWRRTENCCHLLSRHRSYCWDIVKLQQQEHQTDSCRQVIYFLIIILRGMMFQLCRCRDSRKLQRIPDEYGGRKQRELQIFMRGDKPFSF